MPTKAAKPEVLVVKESFVGALDNGVEVTFREGEIVDADDPAVRKWPHLFKPLHTAIRSVEQATAAPGEKR